MRERIWITWETQRRSIELAKHFKCKLYIIRHEGLLRFPLSVISTFKIFAKTKSSVVFVQNPSMLLAGVACLYGFFSGTPIVVDRHSNFLLTEKKRSRWYIFIFNILHRFTIKSADLTIVTNDFLAQEVRSMGGNPFALQDKIPTLQHTRDISLKGKQKLLLISSFHLDEPIQEVFEAMRNFVEKGLFLYITGNYKRLDSEIRRKAPENVVLTGFLDEEDFMNMLFSVDAIMALTKIDHCMLCGCYEAIAAGTPLITSNKKVLVDYFKDAIFVDNTPEGISTGISSVLDNIEVHRAKMFTLRDQLKRQWEEKADQLEKKLEGWQNGSLSHEK